MFNDTPLWMVETREKLEEMVERLTACGVVGVDTESDSFHHYREKVCLIQFSDLDTDYIVDPLGLPDLSPLAALFADPKVVKIFHGADYDIVCLKRDFGFDIHNIFDTMVAAQLVGRNGVGLADLIGRHFGHEIDKQYQRHDWSRRPLEPEHLEYARGDTHFLLALRELYTWKLRSLGRLGHLQEECTILEKREWEGRTFDEHAYLRVKQSGHLDDVGKRVLRRLWLYRDQEAQAMDRPPFKVLSDRVLVQVAEKRPRDDKALDRLYSRQTAMKRRFGKGILEAVRLGMDDDFDVPATPRRKKGKRRTLRLSGRSAERAFTALKDWRNDLVEAEDGLSPITVASNNVLKAIAQARPTNLDELQAVPDVRRWQVADFGARILGVLDSAAPIGDDDDESSDDESGDKPKKRRRRRRRSGTSAG